jgi:chemotaxis protein methyltransferase CheR
VTEAIAKVAELVERESGIVVKESQMEALVTALRRVSPEATAEALLAGGDSAEQALLLGRLIDQLAVQETFFLREPGELEAIDWHQLLAAAHGRGAGEVNVWVAACASGEEAYSVAMLATEAFGHGRPPVSIIATDISMRALSRAEAGVYSERSVRELSPERRDRFLVRERDRNVVGDQLRSLVRLRRHNLVADPTPPPGEVHFDIVLCRNVLIYFGVDTSERVVASLESALQPAGRLILGAADRLVSSTRRLGAMVPGGERPDAAPRRTPSPRPRADRPSPTRRAHPSSPGRAAAPLPESAAAVPADVDQAIEAADRGAYEEAIELAGRVLQEEPLNAAAHYVRGMSELANGNPEVAVESLRRALYVEPQFALAAFQLARAYDLQADEKAARRLYAQTLRALAGDEDHSRLLLEQGDVGEIAAACRARIALTG